MSADTLAVHGAKSGIRAELALAKAKIFYNADRAVQLL
jgi:hypothetical protein